MTTICEMCGHDSKVIETREVKIRLSGITGLPGRVRYRARTQCRMRECLDCQYRWKTMEVPIRKTSRVWNKKAVEKVSRRTRVMK